MRTLWEHCLLSLLLDEKATPRGQVLLPDDLRERMWGYGVRNFLLLPRNVGWLLGANTARLSLYGYSHTKRAFLEHIISTPGLATGLTSLNLHCNFRVENDGFACIARCTNLESLVLYGCVGLSDSNLIDICRSCTKITFLDIGECIKVSVAGLVDGVASHLPQLVSLRISATTCDDPVLQSLAKLTQLRSLDVSGCRGDKAVPFELLGALTGLRSLNLNYTSVDDAQLAEIVRCCTELTHLQLSRCGQLVRGETFRQVLTSLPRLESLVASNNVSVSVDSFCAPAPVGGETTSTTPKMTPSSLTELDVSGCVWITDAALAALCRLLPSLTSLALADCRSITDWSPLTADARGGLASSLAHLKLNGTGVNNAALAGIVRGLPALTTINLMDCRGVTPAGLACFADSAPALQDLKLNWRGYRAALQELRGRRPDLHATTK